MSVATSAPTLDVTRSLLEAWANNDFTPENISSRVETFPWRVWLLTATSWIKRAGEDRNGEVHWPQNFGPEESRKTLPRLAKRGASCEVMRQDSCENPTERAGSSEMGKNEDEIK